MLPKKVLICEDVTRDGFQSVDQVISVEDKLTVLDLVADAGVKSIEVGAFSPFESMKKMRNTGEVFRRLKKRPDITYRALVFTPDGVREAAECGCGKVKINISASDQHHKSGTGLDIDTALKGFEEIKQVADQEGIAMAGSISLPFRSPFPGEDLIPMETMEKIIRSFCSIGIREISLSDAAGLGDTNLIYTRIMKLRELFPDVSWMLHMHNTYGLGLAGVVAAMEAGVDKFDSSLSGLGGCPYIPGATGNVATEDLLFMLNLMEIETGINLNKMIEAGQFVSQLVDGKGTDSYIQKIEAQKRRNHSYKNRRKQIWGGK